VTVLAVTGEVRPAEVRSGVAAIRARWGD